MRLSKKIAYLSPFVHMLENDTSVEEGDSVDFEPLCDLLRSRIKGLRRDKAALVLESDREALASHLQANPAHPAQLVVGFMLQPDDLVDYLRRRTTGKPQEHTQSVKGVAKSARGRSTRAVAIELPSHFRSWKDGPSALCVEVGQHRFIVDRWRGGPFARFVQEYQGGEFSAKPVTIGKLSGYRLSRLKRVERYLLADAGDKFDVTVVEGDASIIEPCLATLKIA